MFHELTFRSMNTYMQVLLESTYPLSTLESPILERFANAEERFSRFLPHSELSLLNERTGCRWMVSNDMLEVLALSQHYYEITEGAFNIFILPAMERAGYRKTFDSLKGRRIKVDTHQSLKMKLMNVDIDPAMHSVHIPPEQQMDLGGIVKSWTVKTTAAIMRNQWDVRRGLIHAGGDVEVWGGASECEPWIIGIANPNLTETSEEVKLCLRNGAVATSSTQHRSWETNEGKMHHLIDTRTMMPSLSSIKQCTVIGKDLIDCEIWAKVFCILGLEEGTALFQNKTQGMEVLLYSVDGEVHRVKPLNDMLHPEWIGLEGVRER